MVCVARQEAEAAQGRRLSLQVELPSFPHAVVYQQAATAPAAPGPDPAGSASERGGPILQVIPDPEVGAAPPVPPTVLHPCCRLCMHALPFCLVRVAWCCFCMPALLLLGRAEALTLPLLHAFAAGGARESVGTEGGQAGAQHGARRGGPRRQAQHARACPDRGRHRRAAQPVLTARYLRTASRPDFISHFHCFADVSPTCKPLPGGAALPMLCQGPCSSSEHGVWGIWSTPVGLSRGFHLLVQAARAGGARGGVALPVEPHGGAPRAHQGGRCQLLMCIRGLLAPVRPFGAGLSSARNTGSQRPFAVRAIQIWAGTGAG